MQKPFAHSPVNKKARDSSLSRWELSIVASVGAIMLFMISFAFVTQPSRTDSAANGSLYSSGEFSPGMPSRNEPRAALISVRK
jgi:hypothetical protein